MTSSLLEMFNTDLDVYRPQTTLEEKANLVNIVATMMTTSQRSITSISELPEYTWSDDMKGVTSLFVFRILCRNDPPTVAISGNYKIFQESSSTDLVINYMSTINAIMGDMSIIDIDVERLHQTISTINPKKIVCWSNSGILLSRYLELYPPPQTAATIYTFGSPVLVPHCINFYRENDWILDLVMPLYKIDQSQFKKDIMYDIVLGTSGLSTSLIILSNTDEAVRPHASFGFLI
jgi:hypothetical protein